MAAALPGAAVEVAAPPAEIVALVYFAAGLALLAPVRRAVVTGLHTGGGRGLAFLALAVLAAVMSWAAVLATREGEAAIAIVEDGAVARTPGGRTIVVDGGRNAGPLLAELDRLLPIWDRRVDLYVATAWRPEQGGALNDVVRRVPVDRVAGPPLPEDDRRWAALMSERQLALTVIDRPTDVALGDGSHLWLEPAAALAVRLALPSATVALSEAGRRRGASIGVAKEGGTPPVVAIGGTRYAIARHGAVRLVFGPELRVYLDRP
jgi:hypothetical protein